MEKVARIIIWNWILNPTMKCQNLPKSAHYVILQKRQYLGGFLEHYVHYILSKSLMNPCENNNRVDHGKTCFVLERLNDLRF